MIMKKKSYSVFHTFCSDNSSYGSLHDCFICVVHDFKPTTKNIKKLVKELFPEKTINELYMTLSEQIQSNYATGMITVNLSGKYDDNYNGVTLKEII